MLTFRISTENAKNKKSYKISNYCFAIGKQAIMFKMLLPKM